MQKFILYLGKKNAEICGDLLVNGDFRVDVFGPAGPDGAAGTSGINTNIVMVKNPLLSDCGTGTNDRKIVIPAAQLLGVNQG